jgi:hypothetical protein
MPSRNDVISGTDNQKLMEEIFTDTFETDEIQANTALMKMLKRGHMQAELRKGRFVQPLAEKS